MFCTKCGRELNNESGKCLICEDVEEVIDTKTSVCNKEKPKIGLSIFCFIAAIVILVLTIVAAMNVSNGGYNISQIESVGGRTLEEAYYHDLGKVYKGISMMMYSIGIFFSSIFTYLGLKNIKNNKEA